MKTIMILGGSSLQYPAVETAKSMGLRVVVADMNPQAVAFSDPVVVPEIVDTTDIPGILVAARRNHIDGILTLASDMPVRTAALVAKELGLISVSEETAKRATNKALMRECLKENSVPIPVFFVVQSYTEYVQALRCLPGKAIIKPAENSGSRGVYLISDKKEKEKIRAAFDYCNKYAKNGIIMVEEFMQGNEVSVEALSVNGKIHIIQITDKLTTKAPHFVEMGHSQPTSFALDIQKDIIRSANDTIKAIGIENGPSHTELIVTDDGAKIVEIGARLAGDYIATHLVPLSTGVDMVKCCIQIALGEKPVINEAIKKGAAIQYYPQKPGTFLSITGIEEARAIQGVKKVSFDKKAGDTISVINSSVARMGFVIAQADNAKIAQEVCEKALSLIDVEIRD